MISKFWEQLFKYSDWLKENDRMKELKVVRRVEDILQHVYDQSLALETVQRKDKRKAQNILEKLVEGVEDVEHLKDPTDGDEYYKFDGYRYNKPQDVLEAILLDRENVIKIKTDNARALNEASAELAKFRRQSADAIQAINKMEKLITENKALKEANKALTKELENTQKDYIELSDFVKKGE